MEGWALLLGFVTIQRLAELVYARANTRLLLARGGREAGASHYPLMILFHGGWLAGLWLYGWGRPVEPFFALLFMLLEMGRAWVLGTLGRRWTTRIIVVPDETLVRRGPFRLVRHPNYLVVAGEIAVVPLALGLAGFALLATGAHALLLAIRIDAEDRALRPAHTDYT